MVKFIGYCKKGKSIKQNSMTYCNHTVTNFFVRAFHKLEIN